MTDIIQSVKPLTNIDDDEYLMNVVPAMVDYAKAECNNDFKNENGEEELPGGVKMFVAKAVEHNKGQTGIKSRTMGNVHYTYNTSLPQSIIDYLKPYRRLSW